MSQAAPVENDDTTARAGEDPRPAEAPLLSVTGPPLFSRSEIAEIDRLLPYLSYVDGQLAVEGTPLTQLWSGPHPLLLYVPDRAVDNYQSIQRAFAPHFDLSINCAVKACYVGGVLTALRDVGAGVEVASELEWRLARSLGFRPDQTVANGLGRTPAHLDRLLNEQGLLLDIDSESELEQIEWQAERLGAKPKIMVRVNPLPNDAFFSERSKLGLSSEEAQLLLERVARSPHLELHGLHAHQLVRCTDPEQFGLLTERMRELRDAFTTAHSTGLRTLDLGGGIETRYLLERGGHTIEDFADAAREALSGASGLHIVLEPGRYVFGDAAVVVTGVMGTKRKAGHNWVIAGVGCNLLPPTSDRAYPTLPVVADESQAWERWHVADPTPAPSRLYLDAILPSETIEDGLVLLGCGAYTAVRASLWSTDLPDIGFMSDGGVELVFDRAGQDAAFQALYGVDLISAD